MSPVAGSVRSAAEMPDPAAARAIQRLSSNWSCRSHRVSSPWRLSCPLWDELCKTTGLMRSLLRRFQLFARGINGLAEPRGSRYNDAITGDTRHGPANRISNFHPCRRAWQFFQGGGRSCRFAIDGHQAYRMAGIASRRAAAQSQHARHQPDRGRRPLLRALQGDPQGRRRSRRRGGPAQRSAHRHVANLDIGGIRPARRRSNADRVHAA